MVEGPERVVGEAVVEAGDVVGREGHGHERDVVVLERARRPRRRGRTSPPTRRGGGGCTPSIARTRPPGLGSQGESPESWCTGSRLATMTRSCRPAPRPLTAAGPVTGRRRPAGGPTAPRPGGTDGPGPRPGAAHERGLVRAHPDPAGAGVRRCAGRRPGRRGPDGRSAPTPRRSTSRVRACASRPRKARTTDASLLTSSPSELADRGAVGHRRPDAAVDGDVQHGGPPSALSARPGGVAPSRHRCRTV